MSTRAAIYVRISDDRSGEGIGVDRQEKDARKHAKSLGWSVARVFTENDTSAYKRRKIALPGGRSEFRVVRPEFRAMLDELEAGNLDALVAYDLDRVARDPRDLEDLIDLREQRGIRVASVTGSFRLDSDADVTMARVMVAVANKSSRDTGRRVARAHEDSATRGTFAGGRRRMGYTKNASELVQPEADEITWAYRHVAAGGTLESIVRRWRQTLGTGPLGGVITGVQVRDVLLRPMNAGLSFYKGTEVGHMTNVPALIDEDTWRTVHAILLDPSRRTTQGRPSTHLLSSVLRCGACSGRMGGKYRRHSRNERKDPVYACREGHVSRQRERMDAAIGALVVAYLKENASALAVAPVAEVADPASDEARKLHERLDALSSMLAIGDLEPADYAQAARKVRERLTVLQERLARQSSRPGTLALLADADIEAAWLGASLEDQRGVVRELVEKIVVNRNRPGPFTMAGVEVQWKGAGE